MVIAGGADDATTTIDHSYLAPRGPLGDFPLLVRHTAEAARRALRWRRPRGRLAIGPLSILDKTLLKLWPGGCPI